jgi:signal transduction histidine kinase
LEWSGSLGEDRDNLIEFAMNVLIIDDDQVDRLTVRELLRDRFTVLEARSGEEAQPILSRNNIDCVLLDYHIPGTDSLALLREISARKHPVIMLTGEGNEDIAVSAMKEGALDYITKRNLTDDFLTRTISKAVDTANLRRRLYENQEELAKANDQLRGKVAELKRLNDDLETFIHITAHDLKEPLRNLYGYCDLVEREVSSALTSQGKQYMDGLRSNTIRLASLIDDLRELTSITHTQFTHDIVDLNDVIAAVLQDFSSAMADRKVEINLAKMPVVCGMRPLLVELYRNIIGNALKYGDPSAMALDFQAEEPTDEWLLSVHNTGPSIAQSNLERIFQPFCRLGNVTRVEGSGMGLTLCRKIIERHGGRIWAESTPESGVSIKFTLRKQLDAQN